jgi:hypothetical protein
MGVGTPEWIPELGVMGRRTPALGVNELGLRRGGFFERGVFRVDPVLPVEEVLDIEFVETVTFGFAVETGSLETVPLLALPLLALPLLAFPLPASLLLLACVAASADPAVAVSALLFLAVSTGFALFIFDGVNGNVRPSRMPSDGICDLRDSLVLSTVTPVTPVVPMAPPAATGTGAETSRGVHDDVFPVTAASERIPAFVGEASG